MRPLRPHKGETKNPAFLRDWRASFLSGIIRVFPNVRRVCGPSQPSSSPICGEAIGVTASKRQIKDLHRFRLPGMHSPSLEGWHMLRLSLLISCCFCCCVFSKDPPPSAELIFGSWTAVKGGTGELNFGKDGKLIFKFDLEGQLAVLEFDYKAEGDKLTTFIKNGFGVIKTISTIKALTTEKLVIVDDDSKMEHEYKRAPETKVSPE
jgi:uncharacterized protein (TIGR03066 family)